ncbi:MAG: tetratricopeptide repeat protein, partial [Thermoanaerobaculia bacterium]
MPQQPDLELSQQWIEELSELQGDEALESFFGRHPHLIDAAVIEDLCDRVPTVIRMDMERAAALSSAARWLAEKIGDEYLIGRSERACANLSHSRGNFKRAQEFYESALSKFEHLSMDREAAITKTSGLVNLAYLGDYDRVFEWEKSSRKYFTDLDDRVRIAILDNYVYGIFFRQYHLEESESRFTSSYDEFLYQNNSQMAAIALRNIAACQINLHRFDRALTTYKKSREYCVEHGLTRLIGEVDYNIAYLHYLKGEYTQAIQLYQVTRQHCDEEGDDYHRALCDLDQSEVCVELNLVEEARLLSKTAYESFEKLGMPYETAKSLTNLAIALSRQNNIELSLEHFARARQMFKRENNDVWTAMIDFYVGSVLFREGRFFESLAVVTDA